MKKLLLVVPIVALLAAGCNSSWQANNQNPAPIAQTPNVATSTEINTASWQNYVSKVVGYNFTISFKYPTDWTVLNYPSPYPDEFKILPTATLNTSAAEKPIFLEITDNCLNTQCLTRFSADQIVNGKGADSVPSTILKKITLVDGTKGYYVKASNNDYQYVFVYKNQTEVTFTTSLYPDWMTKIVSTLQFK